MIRNALICLALMTVGADPAPPKPAPAPVFAIAGELKADAYKLVRLDASGADPSAAIIWDVSPETVADIDDQGRRLIFTGPPGRYNVRCIAVRLAADGKTEAKTARTVVVIAGVTPPAPVPPAPVPNPKPPTPVPSDLTNKVRAAHDRDRAAGRAGDSARFAQYADAFDSGAALAMIADPARAVSTPEAVMAAIRQSLTGFPGINEAPTERTYMRDVRTVAMAHVAAAFPNGTASMTEADRARLAQILGEIATAVRGLGQ